MTMANFGEAFQRKQVADLGDIMKSLTAAIRADILAELKEGQRPPTVNIQPAQVSVAAPNVTVTPTINVDTEPPDVNVTVDLADLKRSMDVIHTDLQNLARILMLPVTKTVDRTAGLIQKVVETR